MQDEIQDKITNNRAYLEGFQYTHDNPYHAKLENFPFVLCDNQGEELRGLWNKNFFKNTNPLHVEIGSGHGHFMLEQCEKNPLMNFVGIDYRFKRGFELAKKLNLLVPKNFCYLRAKAERLSFLFAPHEVDSLFLFFPDPWPKARHHKKRLWQNLFLDDVMTILKKGSPFFVKTDDLHYFEWMQEILQPYLEQKKLELRFKTYDLWQASHSSHFLCSFQTKFEKLFIKKNIPIKAMELICL